MKISVKNKNLVGINTITADEHVDSVFVNEKPINYNASQFIKELLPIISKWGNRKLNIIDENLYTIIVENNGKQKVVYSNTADSISFYEFSKLIREVIDLWN